ncbi:hypothetical protein BOTBODRAFT_185963 [Botryobasidium botryosum FD-172 SS1]|uniref:Zn(2)-C6 fungal-type domain-containing protein n=1 Tax=Botryobasidium botryosum (strain FD-172 SS1) TaxID=930990 RepID=A0A067N0E6_BOTB1|nr:hypothetical protein BOTBODRAFT_185963 [Botryobasidium botryosum FD-172 SS1]
MACIECRTRKLKCDGERPRCARCVRRNRRHPGCSVCVYDDDLPETPHATPDPAAVSIEQAKMTDIALRRYDRYRGEHYDSRPSTSGAHDGTYCASDYACVPDPIAPEPSVDYMKKMWWDDLLRVYAHDRALAANLILADIHHLFSTADHWFIWMHMPSFVLRLRNPTRRSAVQPSLVLAALAYSVLIQSSELHRGAVGREKAAALRQAAQASFEASVSARWFDPTLAQAAWFLALFELSSHRDHTTSRSRYSLIQLDSIIQAFGLTFLDANEDEASIFSPYSPPVVTSRKPVSETHPYSGEPSHPYSPIQPGCSCDALTVSAMEQVNAPDAYMRSIAPGWDPGWDLAEIQREELRRVCWGSLVLLANYFDLEMKVKFASPILSPSQYGIFFPGEALFRSRGEVRHDAKESIWALDARAQLLSRDCQVRSIYFGSATTGHPDERRSAKMAYAQQAWDETYAIEGALKTHSCVATMAFGYQCQATLDMTRLYLLDGLDLQDDMNTIEKRKVREGWLQVMSAGASLIEEVLVNDSNSWAPDRPPRRSKPHYFIWPSVIVNRALLLYTQDPSMTLAAEVARRFLPIVDRLANLWPNEEQVVRCNDLRHRTVEACVSAGILSPPAKSPILIR